MYIRLDESNGSLSKEKESDKMGELAYEQVMDGRGLSEFACVQSGRSGDEKMRGKQSGRCDDEKMRGKERTVKVTQCRPGVVGLCRDSLRVNGGSFVERCMPHERKIQPPRIVPRWS